MNKTEIMKRLKAAGDAQTRKTYARHGITGDSFGVRYADIYKLVKEIGKDQKLAEQLWKTNNHDARVVATMIVDQAQMKSADIDDWVKTVNNDLMVYALSTIAANAPDAEKRMEKWMKSKQEWIAACGWHLLADHCSPKTECSLSNAKLEKYLKQIEKNIHSSQNRVKHSMNLALISIGCTGGDLEKKAIAAAKRIGKVEVDHGDTACKTPDAAAYIKKTIAHYKKKKKKVTSKKKTTSKNKKKAVASR